MGRRADMCIGMRQNWLSKALLVMLVLRALIPAGYMPDFGASSGKTGIVICSANGSWTLDLDRLAQTSDPASQHQQTEPCAFSGLAQAYVPVIGPPEVLPETKFLLVQFIVASQTILPPVRAGPAHGSRAPPSIS